MKLRALLEMTDQQLAEVAKAAGHKLFDKHPSGLIWHGEADVIKRTSDERLKEDAENIGTENLIDDPTLFCVGDFEYIVKPSSGEGLDVSTDPLYGAALKKMIDDDGKVYLVDCTDGVLITILTPTLKTEADVKSALKKITGYASQLDREKLEAWKKKVLEKHPTAKIASKPNAYGQINAQVGSKFVGVFTIPAPNHLVKPNNGIVF